MNHHQDAAERSSSAFARLCDSISYNQQRYNSNDNNQDEPFDHVLLEDILDSETTIEDFLESVQSLETSAPETSPTSNDPSRRKLLGDDGEDQEEGHSPHVHFTTVHEDQFRMTMGRHPDARGVPMELSWEKTGSQKFLLEEHEERRQGLRRISTAQRNRIALKHHCTKSILDTIDHMKELQKLRKESERDSVRQELKKESKTPPEHHRQNNHHHHGRHHSASSSHNEHRHHKKHSHTNKDGLGEEVEI